VQKATLEERFSTALHNSARGWRLAVDRRLKHLGLSQAGWMTVAMIAKAAAPLSQIELAQRLGIEGATLVAMLDRLARAGLIQRQPSPVDRRVKHIALTPDGAALYDAVRAEADAVRLELLRGVDPALLRRMTEFLEDLLVHTQALA